MEQSLWKWCVVILTGNHDVYQVYGPFDSEREARIWEDWQTKPFPTGSRAIIKNMWAP